VPDEAIFSRRLDEVLATDQKRAVSSPAVLSVDDALRVDREPAELPPARNFNVPLWLTEAGYARHAN
jgi:hypothetical protein